MCSVEGTTCSASKMRRTGRLRNQDLGDVVLACTTLPSLRFSRPRQNDLEDSQRKFSSWDFTLKPFRFDFFLGRSWSPFVGLQGEGPWRTSLLIGPEKLEVVLQDAASFAVARAFALIEDDWGLDEIPRTIEMAFESPRFRAVLDHHLGRWQSFRQIPESLPGIARSVATLLHADGDHSRMPEPDGFGVWWNEVVKSHRAMPMPWLAALAELGRKPTTRTAVKVVYAISRHEPLLLRVALEWGLLAGNDLSRISDRLPAGSVARRLPLNYEPLDELGRQMEDLESSDAERMPRPLREMVARIHRAIDGRVFVGLDEGSLQAIPKPAEFTTYDTARFDEELALLTIRHGWTIPERDGILEAIVAAEKDGAPFPTLQHLAELASNDDAAPDELILVTKLREFCAREVLEDESPPSYKTLLYFLRQEMRGVPDLDEAQEVLLKVIESYRGDPRYLATALKERYQVEDEDQ